MPGRLPVVLGTTAYDELNAIFHSDLPLQERERRYEDWRTRHPEEAAQLDVIQASMTAYLTSESSAELSDDAGSHHSH